MPQASREAGATVRFSLLRETRAARKSGWYYQSSLSNIAIGLSPQDCTVLQKGGFRFLWLPRNLIWTFLPLVGMWSWSIAQSGRGAHDPFDEHS